MEKISLNETPIRTSRNFMINNIKLEDIVFPKDIRKFQTVEISSEFSDLDENTKNEKLTYGAGEILEENIKNNSNRKEEKWEVFINFKIR